MVGCWNAFHQKAAWLRRRPIPDRIRAAIAEILPQKDAMHFARYRTRYLSLAC
jgi:hypothetical protein